ncbi:uncharacterized protein LOC131231056 [Magnolia sinica]|uniref:uncharacterized protein LOC131231056 n=1 Tax=Magnolia sinica TaxID=86752 RepID=UPI002659FE55|nr:uncharacterized protein LOC131231056 [Magnolia sinica]
MEGEARTVDCLRGRLLAERVTSKAAKEDADLMGKKLIELERQLQLEMESRNRVEKLKPTTRKLRSLKLSAVPSQSSLPVKSENSASSSTIFSGLLKQAGEKRAGLQTTDSGEGA